jgi:predicted RNA-binding protein with RPS1 domain
LREAARTSARNICKEGDEMLVKIIGIDRASGKVRLSRQEALDKTPDAVHNLKAGFST